MLTFNKKNLSPLQTRSLRLFSGCIFLLVFLTVVGWTTMFPELPRALHYALAVTPVVPIAGMMAVVGRYVARETDEFIKTLVTQSVLWAAGCTLVTGIMMGSLAEFMPRLAHVLPMLSVDLFCIVFIASLRTQLWRNA
jgi:hypothetical protein